MKITTSFSSTHTERLWKSARADDKETGWSLCAQFQGLRDHSGSQLPVSTGWLSKVTAMVTATHSFPAYWKPVDSLLWAKRGVFKRLVRYSSALKNQANTSHNVISLRREDTCSSILFGEVAGQENCCQDVKLIWVGISLVREKELGATCILPGRTQWVMDRKEGRKRISFQCWSLLNLVIQKNNHGHINPVAALSSLCDSDRISLSSWVLITSSDLPQSHVCFISSWTFHIQWSIWTKFLLSWPKR